MISGTFNYNALLGGPGEDQNDPNYTTPTQQKARMDYARALLYGAGQQPVKHWAQGLSNMVAAGFGGHQMHRLGQQERAMRERAAHDQTSSTDYPNQYQP